MAAAKKCKANAIKFTWIAEPLSFFQSGRKKLRLMDKNIVLKKGSSVDDMSMDALFGGTSQGVCFGNVSCTCNGGGRHSCFPNSPSCTRKSPKVAESLNGIAFLEY